MILLVAATLVCIIVGLLIYARWNFGTLEKLGIPVVKHHPLLGSTRELYSTLGGLNDLKWMKEHGPIFGVYEGRLPQVFICVPDLIRQICVKDAEYFNSKRQGVTFGNPVMNELPDFLPPEKWKVIRSLTTPAFSSAKIKMMNLPMREATQDFVAGLKKKINASGKGVLENLPIDTSIHKMLVDLIARCVFSIRITDGEKGNTLATLIAQMYDPAQSRILAEALIWFHTFPIIASILPNIMFHSEPINNFVLLMKQLMEQRRKSGEKHNDAVDMLIEWYDRLDTPEFKKAKITEETIFCQALVFFIAAQDQISTMTSAVIYHMVNNSDMEKRVYEEVDRVFEKHNGQIEHEHLNELVYMNACLQECLRLYPVFHRMERLCTKEWKSEEYNLHFKPGQLVMIPIWAVNRNPEYNENPEEYIPDRFLPENKDKLNVYASTAFGHGPRNCTGKRFATEAMPMILAYLLKDLKFKRRINTALTFVPGGPIMAPHEPIFVDVMERTDSH